jgi:hypothetical protein
MKRMRNVINGYEIFMLNSWVTKLFYRNIHSKFIFEEMLIRIAMIKNSIVHCATGQINKRSKGVQ